MAESSVVICGLARQCAATLPRTLQRIEELRSAFRQSAVVVFENESRDDTLAILRTWSSATADAVVISQPFPASLELPVQAVFKGKPGFSIARIRRMAWARNQYLNHVRSHYDPDYLVVLDFDLHRISLPGIASTFSADRPWDAVFSNSRAFNICQLLRPRVYWDTYAFKPSGDYAPQTQSQISDSQRDLQSLKPGMPWLPVASAFGGMGIYRWEALQGLSYTCVANDDPQVEARCEHVTLHAEMARAGHGGLYINPAQVIIYDTWFGKLGTCTGFPKPRRR